MVLDELRWVRGASQACQVDGCQAVRVQQIIATAERIGTMAQLFDPEDIALWCAIGGHSFSAMDPGRQKVTIQQWDEDAREMKPVKATACGEHSAPVQIQTRPKPAIAPVTADGVVTDPDVARARAYDPAYVKWLEDQAARPIGEVLP